MKQELVRINSIDNIEQPGILYSPCKNTDKIVIHVHGLCGNFYENNFIDILAKAYTENNYAFLTFNNRGRDNIVELHKNNGSLIIGGCLERFSDCILDIEGVINWVKEKGYKEIVLEGHSYGCNKVLYYYNHKRDSIIKKIVLLAPCDIPSEVKKFLSKEEYNKAKNEATKLVKEEKGNELIDFSVMSNKKIAAKTFYYDFLPGGENDFIRYYDENKSILLNNIDITTLIIFGDIDECVLTEPLEVVKKYLTRNLEDSNIQIIKGANHSYSNKYMDLYQIIYKYINNSY